MESESLSCDQTIGTYCTETLQSSNVSVSNQQRLELLLINFSPWKPGFNSKLLHVGLVVNKTALEHIFFSQHFCFPLPLSFHQCFILIHSCISNATQS